MILDEGILFFKKFFLQLSENRAKDGNRVQMLALSRCELSFKTVVSNIAVTIKFEAIEVKQIVDESNA